MTALPALLLAVIVGAGAYWAGDHNRNNAWLADQGKAAREASEALEAAQARGDRLSTALLHSEDQIYQLRTEVHLALNKTTMGRPCLNGPTLRLLNQAAGLAVSGLPQATGSAATASGTVATDPGDTEGEGTVYSTDTQVAGWVADAGAAYRVCRGRLDTLIDWHLAPTPPATTEPQHP